MMVPCNYEINVVQPCRDAKFGKHYCSIELGNCSFDQAKERFKKLNEKLGDEFHLTLSYVECKSNNISGYCYMSDGTMRWVD